MTIRGVEVDIDSPETPSGWYMANHAPGLGVGQWLLIHISYRNVKLIKRWFRKPKKTVTYSASQNIHSNGETWRRFYLPNKGWTQFERVKNDL